MITFVSAEVLMVVKIRFFFLDYCAMWWLPTLCSSVFSPSSTLVVELFH
jgi:hypothetical protein